ncbi:MAG: site-2 protease family protein [Roseofilum sp. SBFL]|uniref:site-2 protease family protein n=1 Tax=unclassified Roseofilum TaxID=2620099 RepID=UPI001AFDE71D|nr:MULTISPECIES: site-2 protease family protein [unclassified Roseofilum]MBP0013459.1 site-2 protease family protein [Roseofilum sp. SID3]MBP0023043.1 site-2 protease family protein [Roseofilum sp. SID2]MBP0040252.1 site-2 protease family protein [Roseofilum sp. SID1]MBP0043082.1 site-2 protease family protein [Roseofilum sp. SBFL]
MNGNIRVGSLFGIPFYINPSWFLVLGLVTLNYGTNLSATFPQLGLALPWILGLGAALLLFSSVLAHELGHSLVAIRQGIGVNSITLFLFGGLASLEKESKTPAEAFWVAIAGPAVSLILFGLFTGIAIYAPLSGPIAAIIELIAYINLVLAFFNLIPGLPLDGGNILKALVWKITGNPNRGVVFASRMGQAIGWFGVAIGGLSLFNIQMVLFGVPIAGSIWTLLIGWFLLQNAGRSAQSATLQDILTHLKAEDAVYTESPIVVSNLSLREFANNYVIGQKQWKKFLVIDAEGLLLGTISIDDMRSVSTSEWPETTVESLVKPTPTSETIQSNQNLLEVVKLLQEKQLSELPVVRENGSLVGLLDKTEIARLVQQQA